MTITIKPLTPALAEDFLTFFDDAAFSDHKEWEYCYCLEGHLTAEEDKALQSQGKAARRERAAAFIQNGALRGYLAYVDGQVVGWVNANDKWNYVPIQSNPDFMVGCPQPGHTLAVYCFTVAPAWRCRGIATALLERVCADARAAGYRYVEGCPPADGNDPYPYHGPSALYRRLGFQLTATYDWFHIFRKEL